MTADARPLTDFLACLLGPSIWAAHFFVIYSAESVVCIGTASPATMMRWTVVSATAVALAAVAMPLTRYMRARNVTKAGTRRFLSALSASLAALSAAAILGTALSAWYLPACTSPFG